MRTDYVDVPRDKWGIVLVSNFDVDKEYIDLAAIMQSFGLKERNIQKSLRILSTFNSGMAISRDDIKMSVIFIGTPTSNSQFWNSISHELHHVATAIIDYYGEPYDGEGDAYLHGYLLQKVVEEIARPCF